MKRKPDDRRAEKLAYRDLLAWMEVQFKYRHFELDNAELNCWRVPLSQALEMTQLTPFSEITRTPGRDTRSVKWALWKNLWVIDLEDRFWEAWQG